MLLLLRVPVLAFHFFQEREIIYSLSIQNIQWDRMPLLALNFEKLPFVFIASCWEQ